MASASVISAAAMIGRCGGSSCCSGRGADADGLVGEADVEGVAVGLGVDGDGLDPKFAAGADDAEAISPRLAMRIFWNRCRRWGC
jgi:hypothetical protein